MWFGIRHRTSYRYSAPVRLGPHWLRFRPRDDGAQRLVDYQLRIDPSPAGLNDHLDLHGNHVTQAWFEGETDRLDVEASMRVETLRPDPFRFILAPEALRLPIGSSPGSARFEACLERATPDDAVTQLAAALRAEVKADSIGFALRLNRLLFEDFENVIRHRGAPQPPARTLAARRGACRDLAVLFVDCCRAAGLPARFASGYQKGDRRRRRRYLHAWPEVYLPGAGWRGFDPTHGTAVADAHVTIAAASRPEGTMPVTGGFAGCDVRASLRFAIEIEVGGG